MGSMQYKIISLSLYSLIPLLHPPILEDGTEVVVFILFFPMAVTHPL